jgi:hypothetical protein
LVTTYISNPNNVELQNANITPTPLVQIDHSQKKNSLSNPKLKKQPTISITIPDKDKEKMRSPDVKKQIKDHLKINLKERNIVKNRIYLTAFDEQDTTEIMREDGEFLPGYKCKALNDKFLSVVAFNISHTEIENDSRIQNELSSRGIVCWQPLQPKQVEKRPVKLFFNDKENTILFFRNHYENDLKILDSNKEQIVIRIEPDIPSPLQCFKCYALGHAKEDCSAQEICGKCMSTMHTTDGCLQTEEQILKCVICDDISGHASNDRSCPKYRTVKRSMANEAVNKITKSRINSRKKIEKDNEYNGHAQNMEENSQSYSAVASASLINRKEKIESKAVEEETVKQINNDVSSLKIQNSELKKEITKVTSQANTDRTQVETSLSALQAAILSMHALGSKFDETANKLDERINSTVKRESDAIKKEVGNLLLEQKSEYSTFYNIHEQRIIALEQLAKGLHSSPQMIHPQESKMVNTPQQQITIQSQQAITRPSQQQHHQNQIQFHPQQNTNISSIVHESNNLLYRNSTTPGIAPQYSYFNNAFDNNYISASANSNNTKYSY